jgi:hypothetical protein
MNQTDYFGIWSFDDWQLLGAWNLVFGIFTLPGSLVCRG